MRGRRAVVRLGRPFLVAGLLMVATAVLGTGTVQGRPERYLPPICPGVVFHSAPTLDPQTACMNVGVKTHGTQHGSYLFTTPDGIGAAMFKDNGTLVWWRKSAHQEADFTEVHLHGHPYLAVWDGSGPLVGNNRVIIWRGQILLFDQHYRQVGTITAAGKFAGDNVDQHEFRITRDGDALIDIYHPVTMKIHGRSVIVVECVIQKVSLVRDSTGIHTGKLLFQWSTQGHVPVSQTYLGAPQSGGAWDYFHLNGIAEDLDGNILVSARNTWGVYKINVKTGHIMWQLGARRDPRLRVPWCYQHNITALGNNRYSLYDDGSVGPGCLPEKSWHPARGLIFRVDPARHPVKLALLHSYPHRPSIYGEYTGSMQRLANGDAVVNWGYIPEITQFSPTGKVLMDLSLSHPSYRGFRFPWVGRPSWAPSVASKSRKGGLKVWASWNGATQVAAWKVLGGPLPGHLKAVSRAVRETGFETTIAIKHIYPYVAVQALNSHGRVIGTSSTVSPS